MNSSPTPAHQERVSDERLAKLLEMHEGRPWYAWADVISNGEVVSMIRELQDRRSSSRLRSRAEVIEECARVVEARRNPESSKWDAYNCAMDAAAAAIRSLPSSDGGDGWQDISTAPRDGTLVDLWYPRGGGRYIDMLWRDGQWWIGDAHDPECYGGVVDPKVQPTHWRHRPSPPSTTAPVADEGKREDE